MMSKEITKSKAMRILMLPAVRHPIHFICGAAAAYCMPTNPHFGWSIIAGFHAYEAWQDFGYMHDGSFKDIWEFWVVYIPVSVVLCSLMLIN